MEYLNVTREPSPCPCEYDDYGRLLLETYEDEKTVSYQYDNDGALAAVTDSASGITTRQYFDLSGRSVGYSETANNFTHSVGYAYDEINNLTQLVEDIDGVERTTSYTYDDDNRTTSVTTDGITVEYTYDAFGRVTQQVTKLKGETAEQDQVILTEYFTFTEPSATATSGQVATYRTVSAGLDITYSYTYDSNGNILTVSDGTNVTGYTYDTANQLIREDNQQEGKTYTWTYDAAGNITAYKTYAYSPDVADLSEVQPTSAVPYIYSTAEWKDLLVSYNGKTIEYDTSGNPSHIGDRSFTWKHGRQLATLTENNTTWNYTYNNAGLRTGRYVVNGASYKYVYNGSQLVQMTVNGQKVTFTYDAVGTPLTMKVYTETEENGTTVTNCDTYYYITNLQGDVMGLTNSTGSLVVSYEYSAYGIRTVTLGDGTTAEQLNPLTYRGYVYDAETGLYYLQSRYYDPEIGRFINADAFAATGQGFVGNNMFAYCLNSPIIRNDNTGYVSEEEAAEIIKEYADEIIAAGEEFGVDPVAIAACIYIEQLYNVDAKDYLFDYFCSWMDTSIGIGQVRVSTARDLEDKGYMEITTALAYYDLESSYIYMSRNSRIASKLTNPETNIRYVAAYLRYWQDTWYTTHDISDRIDILCTLYNLGDNANKPNSDPKPNDFGINYFKHAVRIYKVLYGV